MLIRLSYHRYLDDYIYVFDPDAHSKQRLKNIALSDDQRDGDDAVPVLIFGNAFGVPTAVGGAAGLANWAIYSASTAQFIWSTSIFAAGGGLCWLANRFGLRERRHQWSLARISRLDTVKLDGRLNSTEWYSVQALQKVTDFASIKDELLGTRFAIKKSTEVSDYIKKLQSDPQRELLRLIKPHVDAYFSMTAQHDIALKELEKSASREKLAMRRAQVDKCAQELVKTVREIIEDSKAGKTAKDKILGEQDRVIADGKLDMLPDIDFNGGKIPR